MVPIIGAKRGLPAPQIYAVGPLAYSAIHVFPYYVSQYPHDLNMAAKLAVCAATALVKTIDGTDKRDSQEHPSDTNGKASRAAPTAVN